MISPASQTALSTAAMRLGLRSDSVEPLRLHDAKTFLFPEDQVVVRDLHALAGHLRVAAHHPAALRELRIRIRSLRDNDRTVRWHAV